MKLLHLLLLATLASISTELAPAARSRDRAADKPSTGTGARAGTRDDVADATGAAVSAATQAQTVAALTAAGVSAREAQGIAALTGAARVAAINALPAARTRAVNDALTAAAKAGETVDEEEEIEEEIDDKADAKAGDEEDEEEEVVDDKVDAKADDKTALGGDEPAPAPAPSPAPAPAPRPAPAPAPRPAPAPVGSRYRDFWYYPAPSRSGRGSHGVSGSTASIDMKGAINVEFVTEIRGASTAVNNSFYWLRYWRPEKLASLWKEHMRGVIAGKDRADLNRELCDRVAATEAAEHLAWTANPAEQEINRRRASFEREWDLFVREASNPRPSERMVQGAAENVFEILEAPRHRGARGLSILLRDSSDRERTFKNAIKQGLLPAQCENAALQRALFDAVPLP